MAIVLMALGLLPFAFGGVMNWLIMTFSDTLPPFGLVAFVTLFIWAAIAFAAKPYIKQTRKVVMGLNLVALVVLVLVGVQELLLHAYWNNLVGVWSQLYFCLC